MSNPDQIRADIEMTRDELGRDVDALADKVSPPKIMERQKTRLRQRLGDVKERQPGEGGTRTGGDFGCLFRERETGLGVVCAVQRDVAGAQ